MSALFRRSIVHVAFSVSLSLLALSQTGCAGMFTPAENPKVSGMKLYQQGNYTDAAASFRNAIRSDPRDYKSHYYLAVCCDAQGRYEEAVAAYREALDVMKVTYAGQEDHDFRVKILDGLAITVAKSDPHDQELDIFEKQAHRSNKAEDFFLVAKIYRYRGDADMALDNYNHAALLDNKEFAILKEYGLYLQKVGQDKRAIVSLSQAYRVNDKDQQVNGALTQLGIVPGPSLKERNELAQPQIPQGPIPPLDLHKITSSLGLGGGNKNAAPAPAPTATPPAPASGQPASAIQTPRD